MTTPVPDPAPADVPATPVDPTTTPQTDAIATSDQSTEVAQLADVLQDPQIPFDPAYFRKGTVTANNNTASPPTIDITLSGDTSTTVAGVRYIDSYSPVVGDTILVGKQGTDVFGLGQMNDTGSGAANGWQTPTLGSGFTTNGNSNGPIQYRVVLDNGDLKVKWRGSVAVSGTPTAVTTAAVGYRPSVKRSLNLARDPAGGSNVVGMDFNTDGTVTLTGAQTFGNVNGGTTGASSPGGTTASAAGGTVQVPDHSHTGLTDYRLCGYLSLAGSDLCHAHGVFVTSFAAIATSSHSHSLTTTSHTHTFTPTTAVAFPTWVSFNNVEYYL